MDFSTKTLAEGCFGKVYRQKYKDTWAALKKVPLDLINKDQLIRELRVYTCIKINVNHNNVVKLLGEPWLEDGKWHIPLEFIFGEDLETTIFNVQKSMIQPTPSVRATIISGMCEGLLHLHSKNIVHQDLKPDNVMIEHGTNRAVIIDMGLAKFSVNGLSSAQNLGNEAYTPPEVRQGSVRDKRSDVWAMGKIIAELCARVRLPTTSVCPMKIKEALKDDPYCGVVCKMVAEKASERGTIDQVIGEIRHIGAMQGARVEIPKQYLGTQWQARGTGAVSPGAKQKSLGSESKHEETPNKYVPVTTPTPEPQTLVPFSRSDLLPNFAQMSLFASPLLRDGKVTRRVYQEESFKMEYKEIVVKNGRVVKYDDVKITK